MRIESGGSRAAGQDQGRESLIARGSLLSCPVDRDHHRHTVHAPGGQLPRGSHPGRRIVPFGRPFLLFGSGYYGLRQRSDGGYLCPDRCRGKLFAIRNGIPAQVVRILRVEVLKPDNSFDGPWDHAPPSWRSAHLANLDHPPVGRQSCRCHQSAFPLKRS